MMKKLICLALLFLQACDNPGVIVSMVQEAMTSVNDVTGSGDVNTSPSTARLNTTFLTGHWVLDINELKNEIRKNAANPQQATAIIKDFDKRYFSIEMVFYDDNRFSLIVNGNPQTGVWGVSSDEVSYYIQLGNDFIELHEIISLTEDEMIEIPVASLRQAHVPAQRMVYRKVS